MRKILFRGKSVTNGRWRKGDLLRANGEKFVVGTSSWGVVNPDTIGEYTGLDDVHGNKVFEGDIVKVHDNMIGVEDGAEDFIGVVYYRDGSFMIITPYQLHYRWMDYTVEVIGNKFDNPEIWEEL